MKEFLKEFTYLEIFNETNLKHGSGDLILDLGNNPKHIEMDKLKLFYWRKYVELRSNARQLINISKLPSNPGSFKLLIGKLSRDKNLATGKENITYDENGNEIYSYLYHLKYTPSDSVRALFEDADRRYIAELTRDGTLQKNEPKVAEYGGYDNWLEYRAWLKTWPVALCKLSFTLLLGVLCIAAIAFAIPSLAVSLLPSAAFTISSIAYICVKSALIAGICLACAGLASGIVAYKDYLTIGNTADSTKEADYTREESEEDERPVDDRSSSTDQENDLSQHIDTVELDKDYDSSENSDEEQDTTKLLKKLSEQKETEAIQPSKKESRTLPNKPIIKQADTGSATTATSTRALPEPKPATRTATSAITGVTPAKKSAPSTGHDTRHLNGKSQASQAQKPTAMSFFEQPASKAKPIEETTDKKPTEQQPMHAKNHKQITKAGAQNQ